MKFKLPKCPVCGALCERVQRKIKGGYHVVIFCPGPVQEHVTITNKNYKALIPFDGTYYSKSKEEARWKARQNAYSKYLGFINYIGGKTK